ncbi:MAG TPA: hypothetical protein VEW08_12865 [Steroidobacteraceae bacterium]|nr:hypothetical protein [Steroidobacteraceae bacterium]
MESAQAAPGAVGKVVIAGCGTSGWVAAMALSSAQVAQVVNALPIRGDFIKHYCDASEGAWG